MDLISEEWGIFARGARSGLPPEQQRRGAAGQGDLNLRQGGYHYDKKRGLAGRQLELSATRHENSSIWLSA